MISTRKHPLGLAFKLIVSILLAAAILIIIILAYNYHYSKSLLLESSHETAVQLANATVSRISGVFSGVQKTPEGMALYLRNDNLDDKVINDLLSMTLQNKPEIFGTCIAFAPYAYEKNLEGYAPYCYRTSVGLRFKDLALGSYRYFDWEWFTSARDKGKPVWSEPYFDKGGGNILMSTYSVPFYSGDSLDKKFKGVATADISLLWLEKMVDSIKIYRTGFAFIMSDKGTLITYPEKDLQLKSLPTLASESNSEELLEITDMMMTEKQGYMHYRSIGERKSRWLFFSRIPETNWQLALVIPEDELFSGLRSLYLTTVEIGILGVIVLAIIVILFSSRITRPLRRLTHTADSIGAGNFDVAIAQDRSTREIFMLGNALGRMQNELKEYMKDLETTTAAKERIESELKIAHNIQQGMIPKIFPPFPHRDDIDIFAILQPARQVGGDLYDFFFLDENTLCFAIGDVSDKGVPASLMMAITITLLRADAKSGMIINEILEAVNRDISRDNENMMFITFFLGILDLKTGKLVYCNAGHNYPLLLRNNGSLEQLEITHGVPLGVMEGQQYKSSELTIDKDEKLILYTDGITEALSIDEEFYGEERLLKLVREKCGKTNARNTTLAILDDVSAFVRTTERSDDITLMVLNYYPGKQQKK